MWQHQFQMATLCVVDSICRAPGGAGGAEQADDDGLARSGLFSSVACVGSAGLSPVIFLTAVASGCEASQIR